MSSGAPPTRAATLLPYARRAERALGRRLDLFAGGVALMLVMAYVASALVGNRLAQSEAARHFVTVTGTIDGAEVITLPATSPSSSVYAVRLHCRYAWQGRDYVTTTESTYGPRANLDHRQAAGIAARYVPGATTPLFIDPKRPSRAVLDDTEPRPLLPIVMTLVMLGAGAFLAAVGWRGWPLVLRPSPGMRSADA